MIAPTAAAPALAGHAAVHHNQTRPPLDPTQLALELTGRNYLSHSAITTFMKCPLRFQFSYREDLPREFVSSSLIFGGSIHAAIELHFRELFEGQAPSSHENLMDRYEQAWQQEATLPVRFGKTETQDSLRDLAARMLKAFQDSELSRLDSQLLGVEEEVRGRIIPDCPDILGRLDLMLLAKDRLRIVDFKTSHSAWNDDQMQASAPQLLLYSELVRPLAQEFGDLPVSIEWIILTKTKSPSVTLHSLSPDPVAIHRVKRSVRSVWSAISAGHTYPVPSSMNCASCPFQNACRQWEG